jgi:hypothetical protein
LEPIRQVKTSQQKPHATYKTGDKLGTFYCQIKRY